MQHKPFHRCPITSSVPVVSSQRRRGAARCAAGRYALLLPLAVLAVSGQACPIEILPRLGDGLRDLTTQPDVPTQPRNLVRLILVNESGVEVFVEAFYFVGVKQVRSTTRRLAPQGPEARETIVPTSMDRIHIIAREVDPLQNSARSGDVLADVHIPIAQATFPDDTITITIHPPGFADCNGNGFEDSEEITIGLATDCDVNHIPDDCDLANGRSDDCNTNGTPDACDLAAGTSTDCNGTGIPDECDPVIPMVVVVAERRKIMATDPDGTTPVLLVDLPLHNLGNVRKIDLDPVGGRLYFTETGVSVGDATVQYAPLAGGTPTSLITAQDTIGGISLDLPANRMYWSAAVSADAAIRFSDLTGSGGITVLIPGLQGFVAKPFVEHDAQRLYFTLNPGQGSVDSVQRAKLDGSNIETLIPDAVNPQDLELYPQRGSMFWAEQGAGRGLFSADLDGNQATQIAIVPSITGVAVDASNCHVYWTAVGSGGMKDGVLERADLDGANRRVILTGLDNPQDVGVYVHSAASP